MKLKYYLRGLGIGIICTAIIMGIALSGNKKETLTDAEIIERAKLLGMVMEEGTKESSEQEPEDKQKEPEKKSLESPEPKDNQTEGNNSGEDTPSENDDTKKDSETDKPEDESSSQGTESKEDPQKDEDAAKETSSNPEAGQSSQQEISQDVVEIRIEEGDYSDLISRKLFQAGLITDASAFDNYLTKNGLDESLRIGVHKIPKGATQEEIVEILQK